MLGINSTSSTVMIISTIVLFFAVITFYAYPFGLSSSVGADIIDVGYASYLGNRSFPNTVAYLGIPYAEPPLGELRFRAPLPLNTTRITQSSNGKVIDATEYPNFCIQGSTGSGDAGGAGSEDCLKVNIYAPVGAKTGSKLPVLVYIHGGAYVYGNPRNWPFDHWINFSPNVVIVSVYYRLDSFGFLAVPDFADSSNGDFNAGFQDQTQALKWIQKNIDAFGGDPQKVTIDGESAGGSSIELHLVTGMGKGLFSGAIAQSVFRVPVPTPKQQEPLFEFYAANAGCGTGSVSAKLACLRTASVSALARAQDAASTSAFNGSYHTFHPVLDGRIITDLPTRLILAGKFSNVPLIVGATTNETLSGGTDISTALQQFFPALDDTDLDEFTQQYSIADFASAALQFQTVTGDSELRCARSAMGGAFAKRTNAWTYRYNQANPTSGGNGGVGHAAENWMMFQGSNRGFNGSVTFTSMTPTEVSFAQELIAYWLSFVRAQDPNVHKLPRSPEWSSYTSDSKARIVLQQGPGNTTNTSGSFVEIEPIVESQRCEFVVSKVDHEQN